MQWEVSKLGLLKINCESLRKITLSTTIWLLSLEREFIIENVEMIKLLSNESACFQHDSHFEILIFVKSPFLRNLPGVYKILGLAAKHYPHIKKFGPILIWVNFCLLLKMWSFWLFFFILLNFDYFCLVPRQYDPNLKIRKFLTIEFLWKNYQCLGLKCWIFTVKSQSFTSNPFKILMQDSILNILSLARLNLVNNFDSSKLC